MLHFQDHHKGHLVVSQLLFAICAMLMLNDATINGLLIAESELRDGLADLCKKTRAGLTDEWQTLTRGMKLIVLEKDQGDGGDMVPSEPASLAASDYERCASFGLREICHQYSAFSNVVQ